MLEGKAGGEEKGLSWPLEHNGSLTPDTRGKERRLVRKVLDHCAI